MRGVGGDDVAVVFQLDADGVHPGEVDDVHRTLGYGSQCGQCVAVGLRVLHCQGHGLGRPICSGPMLLAWLMAGLAPLSTQDCS